MTTEADRIKRLREQRGLRPAEAAARSKTISKRMWYRFEQGVSRPGPDELNEIADVLDCSTDYLLGRTHSPAAS